MTNAVEVAFISATKLSLSRDPTLLAAMILTLDACTNPRDAEKEAESSNTNPKVARAGAKSNAAEFVWTAEISDVQSMGYEEAAPLFDDMAASLTTAVDDGSFFTDFQTEVGDGSGSAAVAAITGTEMPAALTYSVDVVRSGAPSSTPSSAPTQSFVDDDGTDYFMIALTAGAAGGVVVGLMLMVGLCVYVCMVRKREITTHPLSSVSMTSVAPEYPWP